MNREIMFLLVDATWKSTAILLAALLVVRLFASASAAMRHLLWLVAIVMVILVPAVSAVLLALRFSVLPPSNNTSVASFEFSKLSIDPSDWISEPRSQLHFRDTAPVPMVEPQMNTDPQLSGAVRSASTAAAPPTDGRSIIVESVAWLWLGGMLVVGSRWLIAIIAAIRLSRSATSAEDPTVASLLDACRQMAVKGRVDCKITPVITTPMLCCWDRLDTILLPSDHTSWPADKLRAVFLHELAHLKRHDCLTQSLQPALLARCTAIARRTRAGL